MSYREQVMKGDVHNMMIDPTTVNSRIFIGNIPPTDVSKQDIEERFGKYGPILGISVNRKFGFVQFERDSSAAEAIRNENGSLFRGRKIEVNPARVYGKRPRPNDGPGPRRADSADRADSFRDRSPVDDRSRGDRPDWRDRERDRDRDRERDLEREHERFESYPNKGGTDRDRSYYGGRDTGFGNDGVFPNTDKFMPGPTRDDRIGSFGKEQPPFGGAPFRPGMAEPRNIPPKDVRPPSNIPPMDRTNDCEIIVCNKSQREYAEYIEHWLKGVGLTVDLLFPNEEVPLSRVLANIASRGTLYAIVVMPQNEEHRSLTLNILHGLPQEHRNMPLEDAIPMIQRDFKAHMRGEKPAGPPVPGPTQGPTAPVSAGPSVPAPISVVPAAPSVGPSLSDRHPEAIQVLLNLLADNRQLTVLQYDRIIRYLQDKRELQLKLELGDAKDMPPAKEPPAKQQVDLQHRILNILNNSNSGTPGHPSGGIGNMSHPSGAIGNMSHPASAIGNLSHPSGGIGSMSHPSAGIGNMSHPSGGIGSMSHPSSGIGSMSSMTGLSNLNNMSNLAPVPPPTPVSAPAPSSWSSGSQPSTPAPLLNDPAVQKALDSLMQGNLLHKITPTSASGQSVTVSTSSTLSTPPAQPLFGAFASSGRRF
ncbi:nuclear receptor coactivator 5 isoform X2 [Schistocerca gregaria]|uniref:nuclear receptor coactivator 5 isoform X2 n=1 Tax=Schistocerca gregaria TaxID=7010 RepID=UPI00211E4D73|nr:nuclear receptor coactivator 5 isoform X2 [Schistocerca gregaria]XP_049862166.1 nuclear receptor coactivator 5 isoform X2 [Schistocerca gregaria]XP_049862167.1 nuclear receptor coactivator 5 isoform X2 [Schistocerca gregaria]